MAKKTPLMQLFDWVKDNETIDLCTQEMLMDKIESLIGDEKETIRLAYMNGLEDMHSQIKVYELPYFNSLNYYNKMFKQ